MTEAKKTQEPLTREGIFRIDGEFWLKRHASGDLTLLKFDRLSGAKAEQDVPDDWTFNRYGQPVPAGLWCSAVCNASALGEENARYFIAEAFHLGQPAPKAA